MSPQSRYRTDYLAHDAEYQRRRAAGLHGWDHEQSLRQTLERLDRFLSCLSVPPDGSLLEFGCGAGDVTLYLAAEGWRVYGVDIAPFAVAWAKQKAVERGLHADFFIGDVTGDLVLPIPAVDLVLDGHCLHCLIGTDRQVFFRNAWRALKPGGALHVNTMCGDPKSAACRDSYDPASRCVIVHNDLAIRYFGRPADILDEIIRAGFMVGRSVVHSTDDINNEDCLMVLAYKPGNETC